MCDPLSLLSVAVRQHRDHGNSYYEKCLIRVTQRFNPLSLWWYQKARPAGIVLKKIAERPTSCRQHEVLYDTILSIVDNNVAAECFSNKENLYTLYLHHENSSFNFI